MRGSALNGKQPVAGFRLPPDAPKALAKLMADYDRAANTWAGTDGALADARQAIESAKTTDILEYAERLRADADAKVSGENQAAAERLIVELEAKLVASAINLDEAGNALVRATTPLVAEWHAKAQGEAAAAGTRCTAALEQATAALAELAKARDAVTFLEGWDESGQLYPFHPTHKHVRFVGRGKVTANLSRAIISQGRGAGYLVEAGVLIAALREAAEPPPAEPAQNRFERIAA